jgi:hypothetical protein
MSVTIENQAPHQSGVVLYAETSPRDINPAMARQLGMATSAYEVDGDVRVGTVHVAGYKPQLATDLQGIYYPDGHNAALDVYESGKARERIILDEIISGVRTEFDERGLAMHGLSSSLQFRRVDIIVPAGVKATRAMEGSFRRLAGDHFKDEILTTLWVAERGVITQLSQNDAMIRPHPLSHPNSSASQVQRTVLTTGATLRPAVIDRVTYKLPSTDTQLETAGTGHQITTSAQQFDTRTAQYDVPLGKHGTATAAKLAELDLYNGRKEQAYQDYAEAPDADQAPIMFDNDNHRISPHEGYQDTTFVDRATLARHLDPADSPVWQSRLD